MKGRYYKRPGAKNTVAPDTPLLTLSALKEWNGQ